MSQSEIEFAIKDVQVAFAQLEYAIKVKAYFEKGHFDLSLLDRAVILEGHGETEIPKGAIGSVEQLGLHTSVAFGVAFGTTAMVLDAALDLVGVSRDPDVDSEPSRLRTLIYMVRCAFAHLIQITILIN